MFDYNNWVLCDYTEEIVEPDDKYVHLNYNETDINIIIPHYIVNSPVKKILKYEYEPFMVDLFASFSSYDDIVQQAYIDLIRSTSYINNRRIRSSQTHKRILNKMDLYSLTQKEKYSVLMILTQAVLGIPYHYICSLYPTYHVGELNQIEGEHNKVVNRVYMNKEKVKVKIIKTLRVFSIDKDSNDITHNVIQLKLLADIKDSVITCMIQDQHINL